MRAASQPCHSFPAGAGAAGSHPSGTGEGDSDCRETGKQRGCAQGEPGEVGEGRDPRWDQQGQSRAQGSAAVSTASSKDNSLPHSLPANSIPLLQEPKGSGAHGCPMSLSLTPANYLINNNISIPSDIYKIIC